MINVQKKVMHDVIVEIPHHKTSKKVIAVYVVCGFEHMHKPAIGQFVPVIRHREF